MFTLKAEQNGDWTRKYLWNDWCTCASSTLTALEQVTPDPRGDIGLRQNL
jgi:hypothetical protein